jgi:hypothetical protein
MEAHNGLRHEVIGYLDQGLAMRVVPGGHARIYRASKVSAPWIPGHPRSHEARAIAVCPHEQASVDH